MLVTVQEIEALPAQGQPVYGFCISRHARAARPAADLFRQEIAALGDARRRVAVFTQAGAPAAAPYEEIRLNVMFEDRDEAQRFYRLLGQAA